MEKRLQYFFLALTVLAAGMVSCTREVVSDHAVKGHELTFTAIHADSKDTKTALQDNGTSIWWTPGEQINIFYGTTFGGKFTSNNSEPQATTTFSGTLTVVTGSIESGAASAYWAVYPYNEANTCDGESVTLAVPSVQAGVAGTFADKFFPTVATSTTLDLAFYNVCGGACIKVSQTGITEIIIKSADGTPVAGKVNVGFGGDGKPLVKSAIQGEDQVRLLAPDGGFVPGEVYYAALLPGTHSQGLLIGYSKADYSGATKVIDKSITVHRSVFGRLFELDNGLTFTMGGGSAAAVDLGLSVKWAACNLGATKPEEIGNYYSWGETVPSMSRSYKWWTGKGFSKYCAANESNLWDGVGAPDGKTILDSEDDAAHVNLGSLWRMPSYKEMKELVDNCTHVWTTVNGVSGVRFTSKVSGFENQSIFLPAAGFYEGGCLENFGEEGGYLTSDLALTQYLCCLDFWDDGRVKIIFDGIRGLALSVRPVYGKFIPVESITLDKSSLELGVGYSAQLTATISPSNAISPYVVWVSEDTSIVHVDTLGNLYAQAVGSTTIKAYSTNGLSASCTVTVKVNLDKPDSVEAVDLGLPSGLKWASCNVGASTPEEYGGFFAWGETELKSKYTWGTYKWGNSYDKLTKYCTQSSYWDNPDPMDKKTVLDPEDDAAHVNWGDSWRMPTDAEWTELRCNCSWDWTTQNGVKGRLVTGPNGNSIFLPATGGRGGSFWSSSLDMDIPSNACLVAFNSSEYSVPTDFRGVSERCAGCSVRPVTE